ncbi:MAG TPA: ribose-phosphate diphosphokinase [Candidatus Dependentiae bacterium]|nr:ribose-phosphate diphosphokinase [Candidatus Dependentiae bacterium]HRQ63081.1 ribose-phosphate diphosphokinase [Candidatus Dependentiae bacterium]
MNFALITIDNKHGLAGCIADAMNKMLHEAIVKKFADGEMSVTVDNPTYWIGNKAVIIQSTNNPVHEHIMQVAFLAQELKHAGATQVIAVIPYFGYARHDASTIFGKPGHAQVLARLLEEAGVDELITVELHKSSIKNFFSIPVRNIQLTDFIAHYIAESIDLSAGACLLAPDEGARERVQTIAYKLVLDCVVLHKERYEPNKTRVIGMEGGDCADKAIIVVDDIIDTGGTAIKACAKIKEHGAREVYGLFVHPVLSGDACERIEASLFKKIFVSNTIELSAHTLNTKIHTFDITSLIVQEIYKSFATPAIANHEVRYNAMHIRGD